MAYKVFRTDTFKKRFNSLPKVEQERIIIIEHKLSIDPHNAKPLYLNIM